jgi:hypothetical protein
MCSDILHGEQLLSNRSCPVPDLRAGPPGARRRADVTGHRRAAGAAADPTGRLRAADARRRHRRHRGERLFGPIGLIVAVPSLATAKVLVEELWINAIESQAQPSSIDGERPAEAGRSRV